MNLPNWITLARLIAVPIILVSVEAGADLVAVVAFAIACGTDWLDGYVARKFAMETELGKVLDPLVDKLLILAPLLALIKTQAVPPWAVYAIVARELLVTAWRGNSGAGANSWGKAKTVLQMAAIALLLGHWPYGIYLFWLSLAVTVWSGITYILPSTTSSPLGSRSTTSDCTTPLEDHSPAPCDKGYGDQPTTTPLS